MSSHHIVRDEQEPTLIILNPDFNQQTIQGLLEWSPTVITTSDLVETVLPYGFKIDIVIGSVEEQTDVMARLEHQQPFKYISKNDADNDLLQAIFFLTASKYKAANILCPPSDEILNAVEPFLDQLDLVFYDQGFKWVYSKSKSFSKWLPTQCILKFRDESVKVMQDQTELEVSSSEGEFTCIVNKEGQTVITAESDFWLGQSI